MAYPIRVFDYVVVINVVDGDTIDCIVDLGFSIKYFQRFRLLGVDTPERGQPGYDDAKNYLIQRVLNRDIVLHSTKQDKYGRYLATVIVDGSSVNQELLDLGLARIYAVTQLTEITDASQKRSFEQNGRKKHSKASPRRVQTETGGRHRLVKGRPKPKG